MILQLNEKYKFYVGSERVYPVNDSIDWTYEANEDLGILRKKMSTKMTFENDVTAGHYCYDIIKELEELESMLKQNQKAEAALMKDMMEDEDAYDDDSVEEEKQEEAQQSI